jgi:hypothetical protein
VPINYYAISISYFFVPGFARDAYAGPRAKFAGQKPTCPPHVGSKQNPQQRLVTDKLAVLYFLQSMFAKGGLRFSDKIMLDQNAARTGSHAL